MNKRVLQFGVVCVAVLLGALITNWLGIVRGQMRMKPGEGFAAVPGMKGGQDTFGPYDPVENWRKPLASAYPEEKGWTYSQATDVWAEDNRVIVTEKGVLPDLPM